MLGLLSCHKTEKYDFSELPQCIQTSIQQGATFQSVLVQKFNGENHYMLYQGEGDIGLGNYILNSQCDTVCFTGTYPIAYVCQSNYDQKKWVEVWKK